MWPCKAHFLHTHTHTYIHTYMVMIFRDYSPDVVIQSAFFDRVPYFLLVGDLERKNKALTETMRELREVHDNAKASSKV